MVVAYDKWFGGNPHCFPTHIRSGTTDMVRTGIFLYEYGVKGFHYGLSEGLFLKT